LGPTRRGYHATFKHKENLYIHAGTDITEGPLSDLWMLDLEKLKNVKKNEIENNKTELQVLDQDLQHQPQELFWEKVQT